jgi:hypothetical protein
MEDDMKTKKIHSWYLQSRVFWLDLPTIQKMTLMAICSHYPRCYMSQPTLAKMTGYSVSAIRKAIRGLERRKYLSTQHRSKDGKKTSNLYYPNADLILMHSFQLDRSQEAVVDRSQEAINRSVMICSNRSEKYTEQEDRYTEEPYGSSWEDEEGSVEYFNNVEPCLLNALLENETCLSAHPPLTDEIRATRPGLTPDVGEALYPPPNLRQAMAECFEITDN